MAELTPPPPLAGQSSLSRYIVFAAPAPPLSMILDPSPPSRTPRRVFLAVSAILVVTVLALAYSVMLPFVLAITVAYVLTPAVRFVERGKVPRWAAILLVYALSLGAISGFVAAVVPRLVAEGQGLAAEWPRFQEVVRKDWLPKVDAKLTEWSGQKPAPVELSPGAPTHDKPAPFALVKRPDGSFDVRVAEGVQFRERRDGVWEIEQVEKRQGISTAEMLRNGFDKVSAYFSENSLELLRIGRAIVSGVFAGFFTLFMTLMLAGYMMLTREKILGFVKSLFADGQQDAFERFLRRLDRGLSGVVRGQLVICCVNGVLSAIGFSLFGLKYWPILAIVAAVMSIIPIFGSILSSVPAVAIGLTQGFGTAFGVLAWIIGIHQLEANFLNPKIIGDAAKIHPVLVVFSLIAGEHFGGLVGALFAVPVMSIAQTLFLHFRETTMGVPSPLASIPPMAPRVTASTPLPKPAPEPRAEAPRADAE